MHSAVISTLIGCHLNRNGQWSGRNDPRWPPRALGGGRLPCWDCGAAAAWPAQIFRLKIIGRQRLGCEAHVEATCTANSQGKGWRRGGKNQHLNSLKLEQNKWTESRSAESFWRSYMWIHESNDFSFAFYWQNKKVWKGLTASPVDFVINLLTDLLKKITEEKVAKFPSQIHADNQRCCLTNLNSHLIVLLVLFCRRTFIHCLCWPWSRSREILTKAITKRTLCRRRRFICSFFIADLQVLRLACRSRRRMQRAAWNSWRWELISARFETFFFLRFILGKCFFFFVAQRGVTWTCTRCNDNSAT